MALSQCEAHFACRLQVFVSLSSRPRGFCASSCRLGLHFNIKKYASVMEYISGMKSITSSTMSLWSHRS